MSSAPNPELVVFRIKRDGPVDDVPIGFVDLTLFSLDYFLIEFRLSGRVLDRRPLCTHHQGQGDEWEG